MIDVRKNYSFLDFILTVLQIKLDTKASIRVPSLVFFKPQTKCMTISNLFKRVMYYVLFPQDDTLS